MPIHDWGRVDANLFHDFHQAWTIAICNALNSQLLPRGFSALVERYAGGAVPGQHVIRAKEEILADLGNRITIRRQLAPVVCAIEVISPGNKSSPSALRSFVEKAVEWLRHGVHLLVIDLLPPAVSDPQGIHKAIWDEIEENTFELSPDKPLTLATYVASTHKTAHIDFVAVGDVLPDMPAFLEQDTYIPIPLEATYQAAWASCPEIMREAVERGEPLSDDEEDEPQK